MTTRVSIVAALVLAGCEPSGDATTRPAATEPAPERWTGVQLVPIEPNSFYVRIEAPSLADYLTLPRSSAYDTMVEGAAIVVARKFVALGDARVAGVDDGMIAAAGLDGHVVRGLVRPLDAVATRLENAANLRGEEWLGNAVLLLDDATRFASIVDVIYTANRRGFRHYQLAIDASARDVPVGFALDVSPPKFAVLPDGAAPVPEPPHVRVYIAADRLQLFDESGQGTELVFDEYAAADHDALRTWASERAKALEGKLEGLPHAVFSADASVTAGRLIAVMSTVSGPECGANEKHDRDRARCFFPHRVIEAGPQTGRVAPVASTPGLKGSLDKDEIRKVVRSNIGRVSACYNQGLARDRELRGRVTVQFTIGPEGKVLVAVAVREMTELHDQGVVECILGVARVFEFPKPKGGGNVVVTYPFVLEVEAEKPR